MKFSLIIFAILSITCYASGSFPSIGVFKAQDELMHQMMDLLEKTDAIRENSEIYSKIREIRQARKVSVGPAAYVESDLNSCSLPSSAIRNFCGMNYKTPSILVKRLHKPFEVIVNSFSALQTTLGSTCTNAVKQTLCNGGYPRCSSDSSTATYNNFASGCTGLAVCSTSVININGQSGTQLCSLSGKSLSLTTCGKSSLNSLNSFHCGNLPANITFPTWVLPELSSQNAAISNLNAAFNRAGIASSCTNKWLRLSCRNIPFCSSDKTKLLGVINKQECESAINCLPGATQTELKRLYDCSIFPDQNGPTYAVPPGSGFVSHASPVAVGSFLLYAICSFLYYVF